MGLTDISWPGLFIGVPAPNLFYWGSRPKPRRCAKLSRKPTLLSLRGRLMAGEWQGSSDGKVTGRGGLSILGLHPKPRRCAKPSRRPNPAFASRPPDAFFTGVPPQTPALREAIAQAQPCFRFAAA